MTSKIFRSTLSVVIIVLMMAMVVITNALYTYFDDLRKTQLRDELVIAAAATEQLGEAYLHQIKSSPYRLTLIAEDGTVLFDNHAEAADMENHSDREEFQEALANGTGSSTRQSTTMTIRSVYEAVRLSNGSVLRIAIDQRSTKGMMLDMLPAAVSIMIPAVILSALLSRQVAKRIVEPLYRLDLQEPMKNQVYPELAPLLKRIYSQQTQLHSQMMTLQKRQAEFDQITHSMKEGLVLLDGDRRIVSINPTAMMLFGLEQNCIGTDLLTIAHDMADAVLTAEEQGSSEFDRDFGERTYRFDLTRISADAVSHGLAILAFDVTEQLDGERTRREFTANVSHELKTPLQTIIGSAELIRNGMVRGEDLPRFAGHIHKEASRLVALIEDIIRLSQLDEGVEMLHEPISLLATAQEVCETLSEAANAQSVTLTVSGTEGTVMGVHRLIFETVYNLCDNAIKYNHEGGTVQLHVSEAGGKVRLSVRDSGIGIAPEHHGKIFERFYRVDKSHSRQSGGTGLGLSIVKHAVAYHHGSIDIQSAPNKGTTITITLDKALS